MAIFVLMISSTSSSLAYHWMITLPQQQLQSMQSHKNQSQVYLAKKYSDGYQRSQKEVDKIQDYTNNPPCNAQTQRARDRYSIGCI